MDWLPKGGQFSCKDECMITLKNIQINYGDFVAVKGLNLEINRGEFFTFLGPSGCGKTTTLRAIAGFLSPSQGNIHINQRDVTHLEPEERRIGFIFQNYALFPHMTVKENIGFGLTVKKGAQRESKEAIKTKIEKYADLVGVRKHLDKSVTALSGGQQQRVAIARSLVLEPEILLLDEPLSNLDTKLRSSMRNELKALQEATRITTVYVTHDQVEALTLSDRIAVFNEGVVEQIGSPEEIYKRPITEHVCRFIGDVNKLSTEIVKTINKSQSDYQIDPSENSYIRREKLHLITGKTKADSRLVILEVIVTVCTYTGMNMEYTVDFEGTTLHAVVQNAPIGQYVPGQNIRIGIDPKDIMHFGGAA